MPLWKRKRGAYLVKAAKISDGEMIHLLVGATAHSRPDLDDRVYESFQTVRASAAKSAAWIAGTCAFGALSHFQALKSASASGLEVSPTIFSHTALLAISASTAIFCFVFCKQTYLQCWFTDKLNKSDANQKSLLLLKYPEAYWHFHFLPGVIGYPKDIFGKRSGWIQIAYLILILSALSLFSIGSIGLWFTIARDAWNSTDVSQTSSGLVIALSGILAILGWTSPFYFNIPRKYEHYGLVNQLALLSDADRQTQHAKIFRAAGRMNLLTDNNDHSAGR